jgi:hypothetical protein
VSLRFRDKAKPIFHKEREVLYALRDKVNKELDTLESQGIISKVATSDCGSPLFLIAKPDGNVRLVFTIKSVSMSGWSMQTIQFDGLMTPLIVSETQNTSVA